MTQYDAIIIGAGPAGSVAAILLAQSGWRIALVEQSTFPRRKVCGEYLSPTNHPLFAQLGLAQEIATAAGPEIRRMALYAQDAALTAAMPQSQGWGRALGRETLDTILRDKAAAAGATLFQPFRLTAHTQTNTTHQCTLTHQSRTLTLSARILIEAHGNSDRAPTPHRPTDLLAVKAHFRGATLAPDLMPLLVFPGGYGGLVTTSEGRVTLGCCIRRDVLEAARATTPGPAPDAVLAYVQHHCQAVAQVLAHATRDGPWLGAGPIAPGIRRLYANATFRVGTAAGETHPLVGEGMSMAMQGAWLLTQHLTTDAPLDSIGAAYTAAWRQRFAPRVRAASLFATLSTHRATIALALPILRRAPSLLTYGATRSGKTRVVVGEGRRRPGGSAPCTPAGV